MKIVHNVNDVALCIGVKVWIRDTESRCCNFYNIYFSYPLINVLYLLLCVLSLLHRLKKCLFNLHFARYTHHKSYRKVSTLKMEITINLGGKKRKDLAVAVGELLNVEPVYQRSGHVYEIGEGVILDRNNTLIIANNANAEKVQQLLKLLESKGFTAESLPDKLVIQMPLDGFDEVALDNLQKLVIAKADLIKKALGIDDLPIEQTDEAVCFSWFAFDTPNEDITAYSQFISALCDMAKKQKRVLATEKSVENEKYAFRCFLLRLGFIGDEYANSRKVLLRNLAGNGSHKSDNGDKSKSVPTPKPDKFEESAEAIAKHIVRNLFQCFETIM